MKIQLDTEQKTIKLDSDENLGELIRVLNNLLPKNKWKEFEIQTNVNIQTWTNPYIIKRVLAPYIPVAPWYYNNTDPVRVLPISYDSSVIDTTNKVDGLNVGVFNIEC